MFQIKKITAVLLMIILFMFSTFSSFAATLDETQGKEMKETAFIAIKGKIIEIRTAESTSSKFLTIEKGEEDINTIVIKDNTYCENEKDIVKGADITAYIDPKMPVVMIYPPQYNAVLVHIDSKDINKKFDRFDKDLISSDGMLKLNISNKVLIVDQTGKEFKGSLTDKDLFVTYGATTRSIPAQTTPMKVVVLQSNSIAPSGTTVTETFIVNGKPVKAPRAYYNDKGEIMVPLRALSEAMGYKVGWDKNNKSITLGVAITLKVGDNNYTYGKMAPITLTSAPELTDGHTYVPLNFFTKVEKAGTAVFYEGQIEIDKESLYK